MTNKPKRAIIDRESLRQLQETKESLQRVEAFPYTDELRSVMDTDVYCCSPDTLVKEVVQHMSSRSISSVIVVDDADMPVGILTERDILSRVVAHDQVDINQTPVSAIMTVAPVTQRPDATVYRALSVLAASGIKHLPLVENSRIVGMITMRQLLKLRYPEPMTLIEGIRDAADIRDLKTIKDRLPEMAEMKLHSGRRAYDIVVMLSLINQDIHRKAMELAVRQHGEAPVPFALYVTGSHGRLENLLTPDQDHGMIIADNDDELQYHRYFVDLAETFSTSLADIGFVTCPGYIMCLNPIWRKSVAEWKYQIQYWFERQVRGLGRFTTVLFDAAMLVGDRELFDTVQDHAYTLLSQHQEVLTVLHEEEASHRVPTGFLGRFITERSGQHRGEIAIKRSGLIFMVEGIRILALRHNIREIATLKRISALARGGWIHRDEAEYFESAYLLLLHLALKAQVDKALQGKPIDTYINPNDLSPRDQATLRQAFKAVSTLQEIVASEFGKLIL